MPLINKKSKFVLISCFLLIIMGLCFFINYDFSNFDFYIVLNDNTSKLEPQEIEFLQWPEFGNRYVYRSEYNNIAITFGHRGIYEQYFYNNFFTYNLSKPEDYFCIPDDFILAYNENNTFRVKALALNWTTEHKLLNQRKNCMVVNSYTQSDGLHPFALIGSEEHGDPILSNWKTPPLDIMVIHEMYYNESYVPMKIFVKNTHDVPLRVLYVFQDGAWMTSFGEGNQESVHQYWSDGEYNYARLWNITKENRWNKNNWVGMYNEKMEECLLPRMLPLNQME